MIKPMPRKYWTITEDLRLNPKRYVHFSLFGKKIKSMKRKKKFLQMISYSFSLILIFSILLFIRTYRLCRNTNLGKDINRSDNSNFRFKKMIRLAFGQSKMFDKPIILLHLRLCRLCFDK